MELDFYRKTRSNMMPMAMTMSKEESLFITNISSIQRNNSVLAHNNSLNLSGLHIAPKEDNEKFNRFFEMGRQVADKLKSELSATQVKKAEL